MQKNRLALALSAALLAYANASFGHVTLDTPNAPAGSTYKAVFKVGHGCEASPTRALRVLLPAGFEGAKPMPKAGWDLKTTTSALSQPYTSHGKTISQDVTEVLWTAKTPADYLPDAHYDEFSLRGKLPATAGALWFKVLQSCENGANDWSQTPASGTSTQGLKAPAALLIVAPVAAAAGHAHH